MSPSRAPSPGDPTPSPLERALVFLIDASVHLRPDELGRVVHEAGGHLGGRDTTLLLVDLAQTDLRSIGHREGDQHHLVERSAAGEAFRSEAAVWEPTAGGARLWVPVLDSAERVGVLGTTLGQHDPRAERSWAVLAGLIGELVVAKDRYGDAVTQARRTRPVSLSAELRWAMLPPLTFTSPEVVVTGILEPAYDVAGDSFDYALSADVVDVALFDAMGHGLEASRMANLAMGTYRNSRLAGADLPSMVRVMDEHLESQFGDARFVTAQLARLDIATGRLAMVNVGHPAGAVIHVDGTVDELPGTTTRPLGLGACVEAPTTTMLRSGDVLLLHTDGVSEARSPAGEPFGTKRLYLRVAELLAARTRPPEVLRQVIADLLEHERPLRDDATLLLLGWRLGAEALPPSTRSTP